MKQVKRRVIRIKAKVDDKIPSDSVVNEIIEQEKENIANDLYIKVSNINWDISVDRCMGLATITFSY